MIRLIPTDAKYGVAHFDEHGNCETIAWYRILPDHITATKTRKVFTVDDCKDRLIKQITSNMPKVQKEPTIGRLKQRRYLSDGNEKEDLIDRSFRHLPWEQFVGAMRWTIDKYFDRLGKKDDLVSESYKIADYAQRFHEKVVLHCEKDSQQIDEVV